MQKKILVALSSLMLITALAVVVLGAYTRLADAGLGCPDWPTCYGHLWIPDSHEEIALANQRFEDTPVETDKTWPEQLHRLFASSLGLFILIFFAFVLAAERRQRVLSALNSVSALLTALVLSTVARIFIGASFELFVGIVLLAYFLNLIRVWKQHRDASLLFLLSSALAGLVILQGLFGMWTVTLKLWPQVVTGHLLGGFVTLSVIVLIWTLLVMPWFAIRLPAKGRVKTLLIAAFVMVFIQVALGGWTTSNYAALACPDFPMCQNQWLPHADFVEGFNVLQHVGPNYLGGQMDNDARIAIHLSHRVGAIFTMLLVGGLIFSLLRTHSGSGADLPTRRYALLLLATLCIQVALGISNVVFALPLSVAVAHNAVGAGLLALTFLGLCRHKLV